MKEGWSSEGFLCIEPYYNLPTCAPMWWRKQSVIDSGVGFLIFMYFTWTVLFWPDGDDLVFWYCVNSFDLTRLWLDLGFKGIVSTGLIWPDGDSLVFWYYANSFHLTRWWLDLVFIWPDPFLWTVFVRPDGDLICEQFWSVQMVTRFGFFSGIMWTFWPDGDLVFWYYVNSFDLIRW